MSAVVLAVRGRVPDAFREGQMHVALLPSERLLRLIFIFARAHALPPPYAIATVRPPCGAFAVCVRVCNGVRG